MRFPFQRKTAVTAAIALAAFAVSLRADISPTRYQGHVKTLASGKMKGRGTGSPELEKAARYIADHFKKLGLAPAGGNSYYQRFTVTTNARLGKRNALAVQRGGQKIRLALGKDFQPFNFSGNGGAAGKVVFAGYGITAPEYNYDDYAGLDVKGKIVIVLRHEPQEFDEKSVFAGKAYTRHHEPRNKAVNAKFHGATGVIFVNDIPNHTDADDLDKFAGRVGPGIADIPFVQVRAETAGQWLKPAGKNLKDWIAEVDKDLKPRGFELPADLSLQLEVEVRRERTPAPNVAAYLPGETDEYVIIGAHFDHLGMGEFNSMAPSLAGKAIHHGADDNASGTSGLLELAEHFAKQPKRRRGILFVAFSGEELGLLGSQHYVENPVLPIDKAVAMLNMDMIGRIRDGKVFIGGVGTGSNFKALLEEVRPKYKLNVDFSEQSGFGSSDHFSFTTKRVPVLFFFSGLHADYHKPSDTWEKIDHENAAVLLSMVGEITERLQSSPERTAFLRVADPRPQATASASTRGYGAYFGSVPDMSDTAAGFRLADVRDGSPAQRAGLKAGDIITEFDGKPIKNLYDFTYALQSRKPGDTVALKYKRGGVETETRTTLTTRK
jgi:hypothetical protein